MFYITVLYKYWLEDNHLGFPAGVLQVTWQRLFKDESIENLATYSKRFGQQVNEPYREKLTFTEASLNSSSITVRNVTWEDESCYICSFNVYPDGSQRRQTCLTVQGKLQEDHACRWKKRKNSIFKLWAKVVHLKFKVGCLEEMLYSCRHAVVEAQK